MARRKIIVNVSFETFIDDEGMKPSEIKSICSSIKNTVTEKTVENLAYIDFVWKNNSDCGTDRIEKLKVTTTIA